MLFEEYSAWLWTEHSKFTIDPRWIECGPFCTPTIPISNKPPWQMEWCIKFPDGTHVVVRENYTPMKRLHAPRGYRKDFAFHYGSTPPTCHADGIPVRVRNGAYPPILRIDSDPNIPPHIHFGGEDHILQPRVKGLDIPNANVFDFVKAVIEHKATQKRLDELLGFEVIGQHA
jgi:hypothetical protein